MWCIHIMEATLKKKRKWKSTNLIFKRASKRIPSFSHDVYTSQITVALHLHRYIIMSNHHGLIQFWFSLRKLSLCDKKKKTVTCNTNRTDKCQDTFLDKVLPYFFNMTNAFLREWKIKTGLYLSKLSCKRCIVNICYVI